MDHLELLAQCLNLKLGWLFIDDFADNNLAHFVELLVRQELLFAKLDDTFIAWAWFVSLTLLHHLFFSAVTNTIFAVVGVHQACHQPRSSLNKPRDRAQAVSR